MLVFFAPNFLGDANNFIPANPLQTPADIVPEWYSCRTTRSCARCRTSCSASCMMFGSILVLFVLPWLDTSRVRSARFRPIYRQLSGSGCCRSSSWASAARTSPRASGWCSAASRTLYYFLHFLVILPILGKLERPLPLPESISRPVIGGGGPMPSGATAKPMEKA